MKKKLALWASSNFRAMFSKPYSNLLISSDAAGWVLDEEGKEMIRLTERLGGVAYFTQKPLSFLRQSVHYTSFFSLADESVYNTNHRISVDYFHGKPDQDEAFANVFRILKKNVDRLDRLRISYSGMLPVLLEAGVSPEKIYRIPIGINPSLFSLQTESLKTSTRQKLQIPQSAFVVGSFQKDGQGWGEGLEPKWVKGPDVLLDALKELKAKQPDLFVLLTGPARGFVKSGLEKAGIPYKHFLFKSYADIGLYYQGLDAYLVASREEGGPKGILESMAAGVPLVTTKVGQAIDLVKHEQNGLVAEIGESEALAHQLFRISSDKNLRDKLVVGGQQTVSQESYEAQLPRWRKYFDGFVQL